MCLLRPGKLQPQPADGTARGLVLSPRQRDFANGRPKCLSPSSTGDIARQMADPPADQAIATSNSWPTSSRPRTPMDRSTGFGGLIEEALSHPQVVGLAIGTRPDCVSEEVLDLLAELAGRTWLVVEYGLQTIHDRTLDLLNRGHHYDAFLDAYQRSRRRNLNVGVHVILGLPGESRDDMLATARALARLDLHSVKPHNLYAVRNTRLADDVAAGRVRLPEFSEYVGYLVDFLEQLPGDFVIERLCGDAPPEYLVGPPWCLDKAAVRSAVEAEFRRRGTWQGKKRD